MLPYALCLILMGVGIYAMVAKKNVVKIIVGLCVMEYAVNMLLVVIGWKTKGVPPIVPPGPGGTAPSSAAFNDFIATSVDPLPQALVMTSILVGAAVLILAVALAIRIYQKYGTFDITEISKLKG